MVPRFSILTAKPIEIWGWKGAGRAAFWVLFNTEAGHEKSQVFTMPPRAILKPAKLRKPSSFFAVRSLLVN